MARIAFTARPYGMGPKSAWVFLDLPDGSAETFDMKGRFPVKIVVGGKTLRVSAFPNGEGGHQLNFNRAMQAAARWVPGKAVEVVAESDEVPRTVAVPKDLKAALAKSAKAKETFAELAPSHRKAYVEWIEEAKRPETRERRVERAVQRLRKGEKFYD